MPEAVIAIGSNVGNRLSYLRKAVDQLHSIGKVLSVAPLYETTPYGFKEQPDFLNSVILMQTTLFPHDLLQRLKDIETAVGRKKREKWGPREIDLDIIFYDNLSLHSADLTIPHPDFRNRRFVLKPLNDIAPQWKSPLDGETVSEMLDKCIDETIIEMLESDWYPDGIKI
ncbi:MAG: 2-amino-4-hydroxy-6-hydroxymethyldihydropteridine diphosphokinase [Calditrichaeota bacterium]|nr:2-amino-4-hydroxy-6-hydroxymethyldihydropteridine diphosphokinase [Calditrichota bacterium]